MCTLVANVSGFSWFLNVTVVIDCGSDETSGSVVATLPTLGGTTEDVIHCKVPGAAHFTLPILALVNEQGVETWWPRGYGSQSLYELLVSQYIV